MDELKQAAQRQGWANKSSLTDEERIFVAIAYNKGKANCARGFKQGHMCDGRCYGENVYEFFRIAQGIPMSAASSAVRIANSPEMTPPSPPPPRFKKMGPVYEVDVEEVPLRLRSEPKISEPNPGANVIARLPRGQLVQRVSREQIGDFVEVETMFDGAKLRGFASMKFLRRVERAQPAKPPKKTRTTRVRITADVESEFKQSESNRTKKTERKRDRRALASRHGQC